MSDAPEPVAILIVDDHALFRESIARLLSREPDLNIAGHAASIDEGLAILRQRRIDLVLLDFDLGQRNGIDFLHQTAQRGIETKVLIVTAGVEPEEAIGLIRAGVSGIFLKRDSADALVQSIRDAMTGKVSFDEEVFRRALGDVVAPRPSPDSDRFTERERQVLSGVFEGLANKEIADRIGVSESSVKATLQQLFAKTGVRTRSQLVRVALERYKHDL
jgi:two-component system, NarL family, nitrate/nitrite response regulator NarL